MMSRLSGARLLLPLLLHSATLWSLLHGQTCQSEEKPNKRGNQNQWSGFVTVPSPAACIEFCCTAGDCVAADYDTVNSGCYTFRALTELTDDTSYVYLKVTPVTTAPSTEAPTTNPTSQTTAEPITETNGTVDPCVMSVQTRRAVKDPLLTVQVTPTSCRSLCFHTQDCRAVSLQGDTCLLLTTPLVSGSGYLQVWRKSCTSSQCCMSREKVSSLHGTTLASFKPSAVDCETACSLVGQCRAAHYSQDGRCLLYDETGTESYEEGVQMSLKSCLTEPSASNPTLIRDCQGGGDTLKPISSWFTGFLSLLCWLRGSSLW